MKKPNLKAQVIFSIFAISGVITGCNQQQETTVDEPSKAEVEVADTLKVEELKKESAIQSVLNKQPLEVQARYNARHPRETLTFFGVEAGMTVVEALPGGGWYSKIILPVLGREGKLIGADYAADMYPKFGFFSEKAVEAKKTWVETWTKNAEAWRDDGSAEISAFQLGSMPESMKGTADRVLFIRALHNLARFESDGGYLSHAIKDAYDVLKPGGAVGIVQHNAPESSSDDWANGSNGYLKQSFLKAQMAAAGFEFVGASDININPKDQPTEKDIVWRLPPSFATSGDKPELKAEFEAIGESSRMTLLFRKP